ncbi:MAG: hypothetical protein ABIR92_05750 [Gemmatimonadaceae bacterium]
MQFVLRVWNRLLMWRESRKAPIMPVVVPDFSACIPTISRDVSSHGVRFYSLCGTCGDRMGSSATLCDECARKRSGFPTNY